MKVINIIMLCLAIISGKVLIAQNADIFKDFSDRTYIPYNLLISEDGNWLSFLKSYNFNNDTLVVVQNDTKKKFTFSRTGFNAVGFWKNYALFTGNSKSELLNLNTQRSLLFEDVWLGSLVAGKEQFILHYLESKGSKVELRDFKGKLLNVQNNVRRYWVSDSNTIYNVTNIADGYSKIISFKGKNKRELYKFSNSIEEIFIDPNDQGMVIFCDNAKKEGKLISYLDLETMQQFNLNELIDFQPLWGKSTTINEGESYFVQIYKKIENSESVVDIWYGTDNSLDKKFKNPVAEISYLWYPKKKKILRIGSDIFSKNAPLNNHLFLSFDPYKLEDYTKMSADLELHIFNSATNTTVILDTIEPELFVSPDGYTIVSAKNKKWNLYDLKQNTMSRIENKNLGKPFFSSDSEYIYFEGKEAVWTYNIDKKELRTLASFEGFQTSIVNYSTNFVLGGYNFFQNTIDFDTEIVIKLFDESTNKSAYAILNKQGSKFLINPTADHISDFVYNTLHGHYAYWLENYNAPPALYFYSAAEKTNKLYQTNVNDYSLSNAKQKVICYTDSFNNNLKGTLYYPIDFNPTEKYPLVAHIYQKQNHLRNRYLNFDYRTGVGFNIRSLIEKGYFVFLPDIIVEENGPGESALDCLKNAINALDEKSVDKMKMALIGHSFGGYTTNFIAVNSNLFATYISGAGKSDLIHSYHSFNKNFLYPDYKRIESSIYNMKYPFSQAKDLYFNNNPIYYADSVTSPILLWSGGKDENVPKSESIGFYLALKRNNKKVIALFYPTEIHSLQSRASQTDLTVRIWDWLDYFLKNKKAINWISQEIKEDAL